MKRTFLLLLSLVFFVGARQFNHPGISNTQSELDRIKVLANASVDSPVKEGYLQMLKANHAKLSYSASPHKNVMVVGSGTCPDEEDLNNDASAAYALALRWVVTGEQKYADKSIEILNAWSAVLEDIYEEDNNPQVQDELEAAWYGPVWFSAAEIIRHYNNGASGWSASDIKQFDDFVAVFKTKATSWDGSGSCPNQGISVSLHRMALGVYTDNETLYNSGLNHFLDDILKTTVASRKTILESGEVWEINRGTGGDCAHANFNIEGIFDIAEMAWIQGDDIYSLKIDGETKPRILKGVEYMSKSIIAGPVQTTEEGPISCSNLNPLSYEIAYNHYIFRDNNGYELPYTKKLLEEKVRPSAGPGGKFIPWDTFTHGELSKDQSAVKTAGSKSGPGGHTRLFYLPDGSIRFAFDNASGAGSAVLNIYSLKGSIIRRLEVDGGGETVWDLLSENGKRVVKGMYLYCLKNRGTGVLFIR